MRLLPNLSRHSKNSPAACGEAEPLAQTERQRQANRPGPVIHGTFSPARSWRPAVVARLARSVYTLKASCSKLGYLVPVNRQHPQLAQSRRKSGTDKCLLSAESSPCHSIQAQYPALLHASATHSSPAFCEAFCYSRCQQARRPGCSVFRAACLCRMKVLHLRHVTVCVSERQYF